MVKNMVGLYKSTGYWQTIAAKKDWIAIAEFAIENGFEKEVDKLIPDKNWGWRKIDKRIAILRSILGEHNLIFILPSQK